MSDPPTPRRRSIRLPDHDYAHPGIYFLTICAHDRRCLFGDVVNCELGHNDVGHMVLSWWKKLPKKFPAVALDAFILMPNHLHGIIHVTDIGAVAGRPRGAAPTLGMMVAWFKSMTTNEYMRGVRDHGWPRFETRLWQRNYYEHIVRGESDLESVRNYIMANPDKWPTDPENPAVARSRR
jgi:REP element-mobilizing transposase RayT